jgi:hypothetical protein
MASNDKDFPICYFYSLRNPDAGISQSETRTVERDPEMAPQLLVYGTNVVNCKLQVFYGAEQPAEALFQVKSY